MFQVDENAEVSSLAALKPRSKKWHLEPVSVTKISKKDQDAREPNTVSEVKESHSVFSNNNGKRHGLKQEHQQGIHYMYSFIGPCSVQIIEFIVFITLLGPVCNQHPDT
jgi:hypothetical protein